MAEQQGRREGASRATWEEDPRWERLLAGLEQERELPALALPQPSSPGLYGFPPAPGPICLCSAQPANIQLSLHSNAPTCLLPLQTIQEAGNTQLPAAPFHHH